jgi:glycosyltransferase involved in cell wall biosynthesis
MVSIVIINHNGARWLGATIQSCLTQSHAELEVVIVDDYSNDCSWDVIMSASSKDSRVVPLRSDTNLGISGARNLGIAHCTGHFVSLLDSDDLLPSAAIGERLRMFNELQRVYPDLVLLTTDAWLINERNNRVGRYMPRKWWNRIETTHPPLWTVPSSWFYPRNIPVRFCDYYRAADAPVFIHRMKAKGRIGYWGVPNFEYRLRMSSVSNAAGNPMVREMNAFRVSLEQGRLDSPIKPSAVPAPTWSQAAAWTYGRSAKAAAANGHWFRAIRDFAVAAAADFPLAVKKMAMILTRLVPQSNRTEG